METMEDQTTKRDKTVIILLIIGSIIVISANVIVNFF